MRSLTLIAALLSSSLCLVSMAVRASAPNLAEALARGDVAYAAEDWTGYAEIYRRLSQANPGNGLYWYRLGLGERGLQHAEAAIAAFERAVTLGHNRARAESRLASLEAGLGHDETAVAWFERARADHLVNAEEALMADPGLMALAAKPAFAGRLWPKLGDDADRLQRWQTDLAFLARRLPETHWNWAALAQRQAFDAGLKRLEQELPTLEDWQVHVRLMELVRLGASGHTHAAPPFQGPDAFHVLPLRLQAFADGWYVVAAPEAQANLVGQRVVKLGRLDPDAALKIITPVVPHDSDSGLRRVGALFLLMPEILAHYGISDGRDAVELTLADARGKTRKVSVSADRLTPDTLATWGRFHEIQAPADWRRARDASTAAVPLWLRAPDQPYWMETLKDQHALYVAFNSVEDAENETLSAFAGRLYQALADDGIDRLILDVRLNHGGNGELLKPLLQALIASPKLHQPGRLHVLISGRTFSAATLFIAELERQLQPIFVGEASGSGPNHVGEDNRILLPNTGTVVFAASRHFVESFSDDFRPAIAADIEVPVRFADYRDNRDPVLAAALAD